jgi:hypothetical protein
MKNLLLAAFIFACSLFLACEKNSDSDNNSETELPDISINHEDSSDYVWDSSTVVNIILNGDEITTSGNGVTITGTTAVIKQAGTYNISGSLSNGQILVNTESEETIKIMLNGVNVTNSSGSPLYIKKAEKVIVILGDSSENFLTDGSSYVFDDVAAQEPNATLFSKADLSIYGNGSLNVKSNFGDGIASKDGLIIKSGSLSVSSVDDGIRGKDYLILEGGNITINSGGDGIKSDNEESSAVGYISISAGTVNIISMGDAITAQTMVDISSGDFNLTSGGGSSKIISADASAKGIKALTSVVISCQTMKIDAADDALHSNGSMILGGGIFTMSTGDDGIHAEVSTEINNVALNITKSYEGIESALITVNNSNIHVISTDDGFNATYGSGGEKNDNSCIKINSGYVYINASKGDGLDSNGNIAMTGGTVIVHGPSANPEVGMDYNGTCKIEGGILLISGTNSNMTQAPSVSSTQYSVLVKFSSGQQANSIVHIQDDEDNDLVTFAPAHSYQSAILSSPLLVKGKTYTVYTGGSSTGTKEDGLYSDGTYSGGTVYTSFTISSIVTTLGSSSPNPGGMP